MDEAPEPPQKDLYRDTPVRFLGYSNEVGEAYRLVIERKWVIVSYAVATLYCLADTIDKSWKVANRPDGTIKKSMVTAGDTITWQMLASVMIPGFTINRLCATTNALMRSSNVPASTRRTVVPIIGLACIPFIIHPIDLLVDEFMDRSFRLLYDKD